LKANGIKNQELKIKKNQGPGGIEGKYKPVTIPSQGAAG